MAKCQIWWDDSILAYRAKFPFKQTVVEFLKKNIPHTERSWDESTKIWTFTESYLAGMTQFCQLVYGNSEVAVVTRQQTEQAKQPRQGISPSKLTSTDAQLAEFMRLIPYEAAKAAYRQAAILLHPDKRGGDMETMSKVNAIWTKIQKEVYGQ